MEKILVVDDEAEVLQFCKRGLERRLGPGGVEVRVTANPAEALQLLCREKFDLVLSDLWMPEITGLDVLKKARQINPQISVILITGEASMESAIEALKNGAYDYILKPIDLSELIAAVQKCMEHARLRRQSAILAETLYLYEFSQKLYGVQSEKSLLGFILERAVKTLGADAGSVFLFSQKNEILNVAADYGLNAKISEVKLGENIVGWVAKSRQPVLIDDRADKLPQFKDIIPRPDIASSMIVPILNQEVLIGVICLSRFFSKSNFQFTAHDLESLQIFALHSAMILIALRHKLAQQELDELESEFISNVSHEIRTPLMAISGAVELLVSSEQPGLQDTKIRMFLDLIARNTARMRILVNDLLDFARLETGRLKLNFTRVDLRALIRESMADFAFKAQEKNISLQEDFPAGECVLNADHEKLKQVIVNLLGNALKFTPAGGWIRAGYACTADETVVVHVADSGIGIPEDKQEMIFDRFYQVDGSSSREKSGFGLGLAIAKSIVEHHKGTIRVQSTEGKGATFIVTLPCNPVPDER